MIRPFNLRDIALVHRLSEQGVSLHTKSALTNHLHPVRGALFSIVGGDFPTYVWKADQGDAAGFIQLYVVEDSQHAPILYLSSTAARAPLHQNDGSKNHHTVINEDAWLPLLDQAVIEAGRKGIHSLVAEVSESGDELPVLRHAGFAVYTRQDIWVLTETEHKFRAKILSLRQPVDDWEIQLLYANIVPRLVQLVEPLPSASDGEGWVLREEGELTAFVHIHDGPAAIWMRFFIHPNAEAQAEDIIAAALQIKPPSPIHPVYCCVRRYQSWLQSALGQAEFKRWGSQAVMVKHTVHHLKKPLSEMAAVLEAKGITPTAPLIQQYHQSKVNGK
jgi:hypothetical protein